ncbi:hypothetical protein [Kineococcus rubinsiae]|uniref:hypothetical protein n=1 Tax=Kineococcus rubinsiae TaxID=2609562 RepID=UPI0014310EF8|nr:hypothetical protein [Kineococcus rubinsiae]NIZ90050.1 hypothetical protein [Kineococcus rubinsiae]
MAAIAVGFLALWLVLSALAQVSDRALRAMRRFDVLGLIPAYNFFAPTPGTLDYHILVRDRGADELLTSWRELPYLPANPFAFAWNPGRRHNKAIFDVMKDLAVWIDELGPHNASIYLSTPYLTLLDHVSATPRTHPATRTQFVLMSSRRRHGAVDIAPVFLSSFHPLA